MSEPEAKADDKAKKKGGNKLFLIIGVVVLLAGGGGGYWWFTQSAAAAEGEHAEGEAGAGDEHGASGDHADDADEHAAEEEEPVKKRKRKKFKQAAAIVDLDPFVVNLADPSGNRYVKARISLGVDEAEAVAELGGGGGDEGGHGGGGGEEDAAAAAAHALTKTRVRAVILEILASYTAEEITSREGKTSLKEEIMEEVSALMHSGEVMEVLLTDLIVQ